MAKEVFLAFPSQPREIRETIERTIRIFSGQKPGTTLVPWTGLDVSGRLISQAILSKINASTLLIADISALNPNVSYEIGYAIGSKKPTKLIINKIYQERTSQQLRQIGLFDTVGWHVYENSEDLAEHFVANIPAAYDSMFVPSGFDKKTPVYLVDGPHRSEVAVRIVQQAKRNFQSLLKLFDPREKGRLPILEAIENVARSRLVIVSMLPLQYPEAEIHNIRSSFVAGVAHGMGRALVIFQLGSDAPPLDFRDDVTLALDVEQVDRRLQAITPEVYRSLVLDEAPREHGELTFLEGLNIGANVAEEEEEGLASYYYPMDPYYRAARGDVRIVAGRKGSGKSALFYRLANDKTNTPKNIVLDLQPESYQLIKFKEEVLRVLMPGTQLHVLVAIWDYILLLELTHRLLETDKELYQRDHTLFDQYVTLHDLYYDRGPYTEAEFSDRLSSLLASVAAEVASNGARDGKRTLSSSEVTELIYKHPIRELNAQLTSYMSRKQSLWILVDHLDKGWSSSGLEQEDIQIVRALLEAGGKLQRSFNRSGVGCCVVTVFARRCAEVALRGNLREWQDK
jgi:hypothetical protein